MQAFLQTFVSNQGIVAKGRVYVNRDYGQGRGNISCITRYKVQGTKSCASSMGIARDIDKIHALLYTWVARIVWRLM